LYMSRQFCLEPVANTGAREDAMSAWLFAIKADATRKSLLIQYLWIYMIPDRL